MNLTRLTSILIPFGGRSTPVDPDTIPDLREALNGYLRADATLAALCSSRIHPGFRPQDEAVPAITYEVASDKWGRSLKARAGYSWARVEIRITAIKVSEAVRIKRRLESLLDGFRGDWGGLKITACYQDDESDRHDWRDDGTASPYARLTVDYRIRHSVRITPAYL